MTWVQWERGYGTRLLFDGVRVGVNPGVRLDGGLGVYSTSRQRGMKVILTDLMELSIELE